VVLVTTPECLAYLGLASLDELPRLQAIAGVALADTESDIA
jgi:chromosome segregation and condensation protein ScpB